MKVGLIMLLTNSGPFSHTGLFADLAQSAERLGFDSIWTVEHVMMSTSPNRTPYPYSRDGQIPGGDRVELPDPLICLAYAAAVTSKIKLATGIVILPQRHPLYVAKEVATIDVLSGGRAMLGIGSGWQKDEFDALGIDFRARGARTDESIEAMRAVWRDDPANFHGKHFHFHDVRSLPKPLQKNGVPIHIGGHSAAAARRAGRYGDGFFPTVADPAELKKIFAQMREEAVKAGRNPDAIELSAMNPGDLDMAKAVQDLGVSRVVIFLQVAANAAAKNQAASEREAITKGLEQLANTMVAKL